MTYVAGIEYYTKCKRNKIYIDTHIIHIDLLIFKFYIKIITPWYLNIRLFMIIFK